MTRSAWIVLAAAIVVIGGLAFITQSQTLSDTRAELENVRLDATIQVEVALATATQAAVVQAQVVSAAEDEAATIQAQTLEASHNQASTAQAQAITTVQSEAATEQALAIGSVREDAVSAQRTAVAEVQNEAATEQAVVLTQAADSAANAQAEAINEVLNQGATVQAEANNIRATQAAVAENQLATAQAQIESLETAQAESEATVAALETRLAESQSPTQIAPTMTLTATETTSLYGDIAKSRLADGGFVLGNPDAEITIVEFGDFICHFCQDYEPTITQFIDEYVRTGKARFEYRTLPTMGGELTHFIGRIQTCLDEQQTGAFWEARAMLYELAIAEEITEETARTVTERLGLDYEMALECSATSPQVDIDVELSKRLNVQGTPAILIRYGDEKPVFITYNNQTYNSGGVPFNVLAAVVSGGTPL